MFDHDVAEMRFSKDYIETHRDELLKGFRNSQLSDDAVQEVRRCVENGEIPGEVYPDGSIRLLR